nr:hypothetical protein [Tanacetum cinerariifolium]
MKIQAELNFFQEMLSLRNSNLDPPVDLYYPKGTADYTESSVVDFVPISRESELTSVNIDLECGMPIDTLPLPCLVVLGDEKIDLLLRYDLDTLLTRDGEINFNPSRDIEELERLLADDHVPVPRVFDEPLGNSNSISRSIEPSDLIFEELTTEISLNDSIPTEIDDGYYDSEEFSLLVPPLSDFKQICLREVERFDPFFSLTQPGDMTWVMERPSYKFTHMALPRQVTYSPKVVMYCYYHPHLTSEIPSGESKVRIEVLSVLWDVLGSCRLGRSMSRKLKDYRT